MMLCQKFKLWKKKLYWGTATEHVEKVTILLLFFTDCVKIGPILEKKKRPGNSFHILLDCGRIGTFYAIGIDRFPID